MSERTVTMRGLVRLLGPVTIERRDESVELGERLQRLLAGLALDRNTVVPRDRLIDIVWGEEPPEGAERTLRVYITRLRQAIDPDNGARLEYRAPGYIVHLDDDEIDTGRFEATLDRALSSLRVADAENAVGLLDAAIEEWHGPAVASFADEEWARPSAIRLEERLLEAREAHVEARIALHDTERAVAEAQQLVHEHPLRERPRALLMQALYDSGRQAEALRVFAEFRSFLAEETGLDPSAELSELEGRILRRERAEGAALRSLRGYELAERVGEGAYAVVHRARQPELERDVAIKIIRAELADRPEFIRRFEFEAQTVSRIEHPNVVPLYDYWREPGAGFLVMRLLRGGNVESALRSRGPYSAEQIGRLVTDVGGALAAAHRAGIVHRDVRPANLLLDEDGTTFLSDFGIALPLGDTDELPITSPAHAAPEVLRGEPVGVTADVLSLAVTVFELLTGRLPFADTTDRATLLTRQLNEPLPAITNFRSDVDGAVDLVIAKATAKAPSERYATVEAFVADLLSALVGTSDNGVLDDRPVIVGAEVANPYVGLHAFTEADTDRYHGREALVDDVIKQMTAHRFVCVVGPSGSGKSSAVRAGVVPALRGGAVPHSDQWFLTTMVPGRDPFESLETALLRVAVNPPATLRSQLAEAGGLDRAVRRALPADGAELVLVLDQFEELFRTSDPDGCARFLEEIANAVEAPDSTLRVVATLRADHFDEPLRYSSIAGLVSHGAVDIQPMTAEELERSIVRPARAVGVDVDPALVAELVAGVAQRPAALPLLQFALTELFDRRVAGTMLASSYDDIGGLTGAIAVRADEIAAAAPEDEAEIRRIFGRLVAVSEGDDRRRRALRSEFGNGERTRELLDAFLAARLLAADRDPATRAPTVEVAHEALLRDWPLLRSWIDDDRADLATLHRVNASTAAWTASEHDEGELARGGRLDAAIELERGHDDWLSLEEREWVRRSVELADAEESERQTTAERDRRQNRRLRGLLGATAVLLVIAVLAAAIALVLRNDALESEAEAVSARSDAETAQSAAEAARSEAESQAAAARQARNESERSESAAVTARADSEVERLAALSDAQISFAPDRAILLALEAHRRGGDARTLAAVQRSIANEPRLRRIIDLGLDFTGRTGTVLSDDGSRAVVWDGDTSELVWFDLNDISEIARVPTAAPIGRLIASPSLRTVATFDDDAAMTVYRADESGAEAVLRQPNRLPSHLANDQSILVQDNLAGGPETVPYVLVDIATQQDVGGFTVGGFPILVHHTPDSNSAWVWFDEIIGTDDRDSELWQTNLARFDSQTGAELERITLIGSEDVDTSLVSIDVGEDGRVLTGYSNGTVTTHRSPLMPVVPIGISAQAVDLVVASSGGRMLTADERSVRVWEGNAESARELDVANALAASTDGNTTVVVTRDGILRFDEDDRLLRLDQFPAEGDGAQVSPNVPWLNFYDRDANTMRFVAMSDGRAVESDLSDVHPELIATSPWYSTDGEWYLTIGAQPDQVEVSVARIDGSERRSIDLTDALGLTPNDGIAIRPLVGGRELLVVAEPLEGQPYALRYDIDASAVVAGPLELEFAGRATVLRDGRTIVDAATDGLLIISADMTDVVKLPERGWWVQHQHPTTNEVLLSGFDDSTLGILDPDDGSIRDLQPSTEIVNSAAFSPDGERIAVVVPSAGVQIYDTESGEQIGIPMVPSGQAIGGEIGVSWSPDGNSVWFIPSGGPVAFASSEEEWLRIACEIVDRELTVEEWTTFVSPDEPPIPACPASE
ncbi:MAG: BTAD domain-containing putative transcriptional regulator [Actinomycetota bacterium]